MGHETGVRKKSKLQQMLKVNIKYMILWKLKAGQKRMANKSSKSKIKVKVGSYKKLRVVWKEGWH